MEELSQQLDSLFAEWSARPIHQNKLFIADGPIDPIRWSQTEKRVLFVAKEAYGDPGETIGWDLPTLVREGWKGPKYKFWWSLGYWAQAVRNTSESHIADFPVVFEQTKEFVLDAAIVNIKKSGGKSSSDNEDLSNYVDSDHDLIKRQIEMLDPHAVIFCNTWNLLEHLWPEVKRDTTVSLILRGEGPIRLNYWHPANHYPDHVMFYALAALYQKLLKSR